MIEAHDQLEAELAALRPHDASPDLRLRIADHRTHPIPPRPRRRWALALVSGLAAACGAAILLQWGRNRRIEFEPTTVASREKSQPGHQDTLQPDDSARIAARPGAQRPLHGSETPRFSWPLDNSLTSVITPDLFE
jgi:hypothetical protein